MNSLLPVFVFTCIIVIIIVLLIGGQIARKIINPIKLLDRQAEKIGRGDFELSPPSHSKEENEITALSRRFADMASQLKKVYAEIHNEKTKLETVLDNLGEGMFLIDTQGKVLLWNKTAENLTGCSRERAEGKPYSNLIGITDDSTRELDLLGKIANENVFSSDPWKEYFIVSRSNNKKIPVSFTASALLDDENAHAGVIFIFNDVSKLREVETMKTALVSSAVHQFRLPITKIGNAIYLIKRNPDGEKSEKYFNMVHAHLNDLNNKINTYLNSEFLSTIKEPRPLKERLELAGFLREITSGIRNVFDQIGLTLEMDLPDEPVKIDVDRGKLEEALNIILDNACKYNRPGGSVKVTLRMDDSEVRVMIDDTGIGLTGEQLREIRTFKRFNRYCPEVEGTGLGLYICYHIVTKFLNGRIEIESETNKGSTFSLILPVDKK